MNDFFKFDDKRIVSIILMIINCFLIVLSVLAVEVISLFLFLIGALIVHTVAFIFVFNEGIHFCYRKERIVIVQGIMIKIIPMANVVSFSVEEIPKEKRGIITQKITDTVDRVNTPSKYIYRNGKTFNIIFYLPDGEKIKVYYGWLYKSRSIGRINKQLGKIYEFRDRFIEYKKHL